jgi:RHS repeat-associated protein
MIADPPKENRNGRGAAPGKQSPPTPSISLPKGGGAIHGIGEKFSVNPATGTGTFSVPIFTSPGRSEFSPKLSLSYDSGAGNGPFGLGWHLSAPSVTRKTDKGLPLYNDADESDVFILSDAEDLMPVLGLQGGQWLPLSETGGTWGGLEYSVRRYRPRIEGLFARIERWEEASGGDFHWRAVTKDNVATIYGLDPDCRIADPSDPTRVFKWLLESTFDDTGNVMYYEYKAEDPTGVGMAAANERNRQNGNTPYTNLYTKRVHYGNQTPYEPGEDLSVRTDWLFEAVFDYGEHDPSDPTPAEDPALKWVTRADPFSTFRSTFDVRTYRLCQRVLMFHHFPAGQSGEVGYDGLVRSTDFSYGPPDPVTQLLGNPIATKLLSLTQTGYALDGAAPSYVSKPFPPLNFTYSEAEIDSTVRVVEAGSLENLPIGADGPSYQWLDLDGEGLSGILTQQGGAMFYKRNISPINTVPEDGTTLTLARFAPVELLAAQPGATITSSTPRFMDLASGGRQDLVSLDGPVRGYYERAEFPDWEPFSPFESFPNLDTRDPNLKFVDIDGDGLTDILVSEDEVMSWYRSLGRCGFGPRQYVRKPYDEEWGPVLVFNDPTQSIFLADMTGDGLTDIVRIRNGEACYWPNRGYGRFGAKVTMDNSPVFDTSDVFDPRRIRLSDIDGCGTSDILYLADRGVAIWHNQSGNSWADETTLSDFPAITNHASATTVDLLGTGTSCLVWSSPLVSDSGRQMRYIDLMGGVKPHLLIAVENNLGAETRIRYASSTKFYVQDREAGTPWVTKLAFPVQVAERVETFDFISRTRLVSTYSYRHGYFDGVEREFRGFGYVEQADAESYGDSGSLFTEDTDTEADALHVPPVVTKTWFHTGAWPAAGTIARHMARDYYGAPSASDPQFGQKWSAFLATLLPDTVLPTDILQTDGTRVAYALTGEEQREAIRALKGSILRQEVYAADGTSRAGVPYSVSERNYTIETLQPQAENRYAVYFTHARETIDYHMERDPTDPRVSHDAVLSVDPVGNVLQSISVAYARNLAASGLQPAPAATPGAAPNLAVDPSGFAQPEQLTALLTLDENAFTLAIDVADAYRGPMASETCVYELTRPGRPDDSVVYLFDELDSLATAALEIPYESAPDPTKTQKRLIEDVRTLYYQDDLSGPAPSGQTGSLGLVFETYKLAITAALVQQIFVVGNTNPNKPAVAALDAIIAGTGSVDASGVFWNSQGGYVNSQGDANWWIPSGHTLYSPVPQNPPSPFVQDATFAAANFYLPRAHRDPFGQYSRLSYDSFNVLLQQTQDALGNTVIAQADYRVLQAQEVTDPNGNHTQAAFDALGMVVGTAVKGKVTATSLSESGDSFAAFTTDIPQTDIDGFLNSPDPLTLAAGLLGTATTRILYDLECFSESQGANPDDPTQWQPVFAATIVRETHVGNPPGPQSKVQVGFSYSDGLGREIQKKDQAAPGPLDLTDPKAAVVSPRWIGSGWVILDNKGKPVRRYEPFFSATHEFEFANKVGVTSTLFYDPLGRVVATLNPDNTWGKVVFDPWLQVTWDGNDTVQSDPANDPDVGELFSLLPDVDYIPTWYQLRTDPTSAAAAFPDPAVQALELDAANKAGAHNGTPTEALLDVLGRTFLSVAHNRGPVNGDEFYIRATELDIEGNTLSVTDALGREVIAYDYDQARNRIHSRSMDAGERWTLGNVAGKPIQLWDSRGFARATSYDELQRPIGLNVTGGGLADILAERTVYGDSRVGAPASPEATNSRGKAYQSFDAAGVVSNLGTSPLTLLIEGYDFKGNLLRGQRQLLQDYKDPADWSQNPALQGETFTHSSSYDALNRIVQQVVPHSSGAGALLNVIQPTYDEASLLVTLETWLGQAAEPGGLLDPGSASSSTITHIDYDEKRQRVLVEYGNGASTTYDYDVETFRLIHLMTTRSSDGASLQDLHYFYDPVGNMTHILDDSDIQNIVYFKNKRVEPSADYTYDAIYRLISAKGREHLGQTGGTPNAPTPQSYNDWSNVNLPHPNDGNAMGTYVENFGYDAAGNFQQVQHIGSDPANPGWKRAYAYIEPSLIEPGSPGNRLTSTTVGGTSDTYSSAGNGYDAHGNMLRMPQLQMMAWDFKDQLEMTQRQAVNADDENGTAHQGERTYYVYDASGQRVVKATESSSGVLVKQRVYLGAFEIYREYSAAAVSLERQTVHVLDDKQRVALIELQSPAAGGVPAQLIRFQFGNHLGSACLELDDQAQVISYEEYYPYGSTSYQAVNMAIGAAPKRHRYTGKERDEESGLNYHGARYYATWLGRWVASDPMGIGDGTNTYGYVSDNPIRLVDAKGTDGSAPPAVQPPAPAPQYQLQNAPIIYESGSDQVGKDAGSLAGAGAKFTVDTPEFKALAKRIGDSLLDTLKVNFKKDPVETAVGVGLPALALTGFIVALAVKNPSLDVPIAGQQTGRTLTAPLISAGLGALTGLATDDRAKLGVGASLDPSNKTTYAVNVEFDGKADPKEKLKAELSLGAHPGFTASYVRPLHVAGTTTANLVVGLSIPTGPLAPGSPFKPNFTDQSAFSPSHVIDQTQFLGKTGFVGVGGTF